MAKRILLTIAPLLPIINWHPFPIMFYPNFNRILARILEEAKIPFKLPEGSDNAFEEIGIRCSGFFISALQVFSQVCILSYNPPSVS